MTKLGPILLAAAAIALMPACERTQAGKEQRQTTDTMMMKPAELVHDDTGGLQAKAAYVGSEANVPQSHSGQKIGHIYTNQLLFLMPEVKQADQKLAEFAQQLEKLIADKYKEYEVKYNELLSDKELPGAIREAKIKELASLEKTISELQAASQQDLMAEKEKLYQPLLGRIDRAIQAVALQENFTYVIDANSGSLVYGVDSYDITPMVRDRLGLKASGK